MAKINLKVSEPLVKMLVGEEHLERYREWGETVHERVPGLQFYQQVMLLKGVPYPKILELGTNRPVATPSQINYLKSLDTLGIEDNPALVVNFEKLPRVLKYRQDSTFSPEERQTVEKGEGALMVFFDKLEELSFQELTLLSGNLLGINAAYCKNLHKECKKVISEYIYKSSRDAKNAREFLELATRLSKKSKDPSNHDIMTQIANLSSERSLDDFFGIRLERAEALSQISREYSKSYLGYNVIIQQGIEAICDKPGTFSQFPLNFEELPKFIRHDNSLYSEMVLSLEVIPEPNRCLSIRTKKRNADVPETSSTKKTDEPTPQDILRTSIVNGREGDFSRDSLLRIGYFISEDATSYNGDLERLSESFLKFNLGRKMRNRDNRPTEIQIRNFFDDVKIGYALEGKIPNVADLERIYEDNCAAAGLKQ